MTGIDREGQTRIDVVPELMVMRRVGELEEQLAEAEAEYRGGLASIRRVILVRTIVGTAALFIVGLLALLVTLGRAERITSREVNAIVERFAHDIDRLEDMLLRGAYDRRYAPTADDLESRAP